MAKIINREDFLKLPAYTLYRKYNPCVMDCLEMKVCNPGVWTNDFLVQSLDEVVGNEHSNFKFSDSNKDFKFNYDFAGRDGLFEDHQLFVVYEKDDVKEIIIATNASVEGESTALFLQKYLKDAAIDIEMSRLARGIPVGVDLEYADQITLSHALEGRRAL